MLELFPLAQSELQSRIAAVTTEDLPKPTPCEGWAVVDLLRHCIGGSRMSTALLQGASKDDAMAAAAQPITDHAADFAALSAAEHEMFKATDLSTVVHHPAMDMPAAQLLQFRVADYALHAWDLARALGTNESLDASLVSGVWEAMQPMAPMIPHVGVFGTGPSGDVPTDAPLQTRLLDLTGRRP